MKKYYFLIIVALILGLVLGGCTLLSNIGQAPATEQSGITYLTKGPAFTVGNDATMRPNSDSRANFTIIDTNNPSFFLGLLTEFSYYAANLNPFRFVLVDGSDVVMWVSEEIVPLGIGTQSWFPPTSVYVEPGWNLGLYFALKGTVSFEYIITGAPAWYGKGGAGVPVVGVPLLPYDGSSNRIYSFVATGDAVLFSIEIFKAASTTAAAPYETVTYTYTVTNTGEVPLSGVTVNDSNPSVSAGHDSGDTNTDGLLDLGETWIFTADYTIPDNAPEYLCNTATAEGWWYEEVNSVSDTSDEVCIHTMCARSIGYWKNHKDWCSFSPEEGSIFFSKTLEILLTYFPGNGIEEDGVNPLEMLRVQLLAAELNVNCFDEDFDYNRYEGDLGGYGTIYDVIEAVELFLSAYPPENWPTNKAEQREFRKDNADSLALKDVLDTFNNMGDECFPI